MGVDHNIIRHTSQPMQADDFSDDYFEIDEFGDEKLTDITQKQALSKIAPFKKEVPSTFVKASMRTALFGFLEASQNDEDALVWIIDFTAQIASNPLRTASFCSSGGYLQTGEGNRGERSRGSCRNIF